MKSVLILWVEPEVELGSEAEHFLRLELEVEPEPLLEVRARTIVRGRVTTSDRRL